MLDYNIAINRRLLSVSTDCWDTVVCKLHRMQSLEILLENVECTDCIYFVKSMDSADTVESTDCEDTVALTDFVGTV